MNNFQFANVFAQKRKELDVTQQEVAQYIGVSRAAVSKWEKGLSYPDITLLPKLATYFNVSIDVLLGYEPQLTKEHIIKVYAELANRFSEESFEEVDKEIEQLLSEYYACPLFVLRMAQLYINYYKNAKDPTMVLEKILVLCERVKTLGNNYQLANEAVMMQSLIYIIQGKPQEVLTLLGEEVVIQLGTDQIIATAQKMLGKTEKAKEILQVSMYQQVLSVISSATESLLLEINNETYYDETVTRVKTLMETFNITELNVNTVLVFYLNAASGYLMQNRQLQALEMIDAYTKICCNIKFPIELHGDMYFYLLGDWIESGTHLSKQAPRDDLSIKKDLLDSISKNPFFASLQEHPTFKAMLQKLQHHLRIREEI